MPDKDGRAGADYEHRRDADSDRLESGPDNNSDQHARPVMQLWRKTKAVAKMESEARRARVLAAPDLARRLTLPPLRLSRPEHWNGWIPPRTLPEECCAHCGASGGRPCRDRPHRSRVNDSPIRRQLVEIATEAMARESGR
jgi:hypothetical protein